MSTDVVLPVGRDLESCSPRELWDLEDALGVAGEQVRVHLDALIIAWTEEGQTQRWIAEQVGRDQSTVSRRQARLGITPAAPDGRTGRPTNAACISPDDVDPASEPEVVDATEVLEPDEENNVPSASNERDRQRANKHRERIAKLANTLDGMCQGLENVDLTRATMLTAPEEITGWVDSLQRSMGALRKLQSSLKGFQS